MPGSAAADGSALLGGAGSGTRGKRSPRTRRCLIIIQRPARCSQRCCRVAWRTFGSRLAVPLQLHVDGGGLGVLQEADRRDLVVGDHQILVDQAAAFLEERVLLRGSSTGQRCPSAPSGSRRSTCGRRASGRPRAAASASCRRARWRATSPVRTQVPLHLTGSFPFHRSYSPRLPKTTRSMPARSRRVPTPRVALGAQDFRRGFRLARADLHGQRAAGKRGGSAPRPPAGARVQARRPAVERQPWLAPHLGRQARRGHRSGCRADC